MQDRTTIRLDARGLRIAVVVSRYHREITDALRVGARDAFCSAGGSEDSLYFFEAPGSWELPVIAAAASRSNRCDAIVAIGCIIKGETSHDQHIASAVASGLMKVSIKSPRYSPIPVAFGVLTCDTLEQARARSGGSGGNKGTEAMNAAIETARIMERLRSGGALG